MSMKNKITEVRVCETNSAKNEVYIDYPDPVVATEEGMAQKNKSCGFCRACLDAFCCCDFCFSSWCTCFKSKSNAPQD
jgi:hypothetical protein